jgi:hypothetical protein
VANIQELTIVALSTQSIPKQPSPLDQEYKNANPIDYRLELAQ